jgi:putative protease
MLKTELLSLAGSLTNMLYAFDYGADAGQPRYSLRVRNNEFNLEYLPHCGYTEGLFKASSP